MPHKREVYSKKPPNTPPIKFSPKEVLGVLLRLKRKPKTSPAKNIGNTTTKEDASNFISGLKNANAFGGKK